jgi:ribonuclease HII
LGIKDSKLLTREKRQSLYQKIIDIVDDYRISPISPEELNNALITQLEMKK